MTRPLLNGSNAMADMPASTLFDMGFTPPSAMDGWSIRAKTVAELSEWCQVVMFAVRRERARRGPVRTGGGAIGSAIRRVSSGNVGPRDDRVTVLRTAPVRKRRLLRRTGGGRDRRRRRGDA